MESHTVGLFGGHGEMYEVDLYRYRWGIQV